jgi:hypothetical protein
MIPSTHEGRIDIFPEFPLCANVEDKCSLFVPTELLDYFSNQLSVCVQNERNYQGEFLSCIFISHTINLHDERNFPVKSQGPDFSLV